MKTTKDYIGDVITAIGDEDAQCKSAANAIYLAVQAIQIDEVDNEGEPCSRTKAIRILRAAVLTEAGVELSQTTTDNRFRVAEWLKQQNRAFIKDVAYGRRLNYLGIVLSHLQHDWSRSVWYKANLAALSR